MAEYGYKKITAETIQAEVGVTGITVTTLPTGSRIIESQGALTSTQKAKLDVMMKAEGLTPADVDDLRAGR